MEPQLPDVLRLIPFLAEAAAMLGMAWLLKRWMRPPQNFGGRYWRALLASMAALPVTLIAIFLAGFAASLAYQSAGGQHENFSGEHLFVFMLGTIGRALLIWPFVIAWLIVKPPKHSEKPQAVHHQTPRPEPQAYQGHQTASQHETPDPDRPAPRPSTARGPEHERLLNLCRRLRTDDLALDQYESLAKAAGASIRKEGLFGGEYIVTYGHIIASFNNIPSLKPWFIEHILPVVESA